MQELVIILVVALIFIGPAKLPKMARTIGKGMRELRRASDDLKNAVMLDDDEDDSWRRPPETRAPLPPYQDQSTESAQIAGSLVATGEADDDKVHTADDAEPANTIARDGVVPTAAIAAAAADGSPAAASSEPDPMDADDHSGMPFGPDSPELKKVIEEAKNQFAPKTELVSSSSDDVKVPSVDEASSA